MKESIDNKEDLVMNQSYNYNLNRSQNLSENQNQNILQISKNNNESQFNYDSDNYPNPNYLLQSEKKFLNFQILPNISTKKSTKTSKKMGLSKCSADTNFVIFFPRNSC